MNIQPKNLDSLDLCKKFIINIEILIIYENIFNLDKGLEGESDKRSIIVGGLTKDIPLDKIINAFQKLEMTGGGKIQNFEIYDHDKVRITYLNRQGELINISSLIKDI